MDQNTLQSILTIGETAAVEFKRCGSGIESDTYTCHGKGQNVCGKCQSREILHPEAKESRTNSEKWELS